MPRCPGSVVSPPQQPFCQCIIPFGSHQNIKIRSCTPLCRANGKELFIWMGNTCPNSRDHSIVINSNGQHPFSCRSTSAVIALQMFFSAPYWGTLVIIDFHQFSLQQSTWDFAGRSLFGPLCYCAGRMHNYSYSIIPGCLFSSRVHVHSPLTYLD